jgi:methylated-DNA-protein-cysteine methyltransferase-like protein
MFDIHRPRLAASAPGEFRRRVCEVIANLSPGEVLSYGDVAAEAGYPGAARAVGAVLAASDGLPWWRVVMASGSLAPGKEERQARLLASEGVAVRSGRVVRPER